MEFWAVLIRLRINYIGIIPIWRQTITWDGATDKAIRKGIWPGHLEKLDGEVKYCHGLRIIKE